MSVTIKDIAKAAGVYPSAVSAVLNNRAYTRVSAARREHIRRVAAELGYRPDRQAVCLRRGMSASIGVFLPAWPDVLLLELVNGLSTAAREFDLPLSYDFGMDPSSYGRFIRQTADRRHSAIVSYVPLQMEYLELNNELRPYLDAGGKVVQLNTMRLPTSQLEGAAAIDIDESRGGRLAAEYLLARDNDTLVFCGFLDNVSRIRQNAFTAAVNEAGRGSSLVNYSFDRQLFTPDTMIPVIDRIFAECGSHPGIFCPNGCNVDRYVIERALELGKRPGRDFDLVAYDAPLRRGDYHPVPRVIQPFFRMGELAAEMLDQLLAGQTPAPVLLAPQLVVPEDPDAR